MFIANSGERQRRRAGVAVGRHGYPNAGSSQHRDRRGLPFSQRVVCTGQQHRHGASRGQLGSTFGIQVFQVISRQRAVRRGQFRPAKIRQLLSVQFHGQAECPRGLTPESMQAITVQAYMEMLEAGFTRVGEFHYLHHDCDGKAYANAAELFDRICAAALTTGIELTLLPVFYAPGNFGGQAPTRGQLRFITSIDQFEALFKAAERSARTLPGATVGVTPHSLRAVTPQELRTVVSLCPDGPIHIMLQNR
jgi:hypothetical protein